MVYPVYNIKFLLGVWLSLALICCSSNVQGQQKQRIYLSSQLGSEYPVSYDQMFEQQQDGKTIRILLNPMFDAATTRLDRSHAISMKLGDGHRYYFIGLNEKENVDSLFYDKDQVVPGITQFLDPNKMRTNMDDIKFSHDMLASGLIPTKFKEACNLRTFEASDIVTFYNNQSGQVREYGIGVTETYLCIIPLGKDETFYDTIKWDKVAKPLARCNFRASANSVNPQPLNQYRITALAARQAEPGDESLLARLYMVDESGAFEVVDVKVEDNILYCGDRRTYGLGAYELDPDNHPLRLARAFANEVSLKEEVLADMTTHFTHAFVESITSFNGSILYTRGIKMPRAPFLTEMSMRRTSLVPESLYQIEEDRRFSIQAMEVYTYKRVRYMHFAGIDFYTNNAELTRKDPFYVRCAVASNGTLPSKLPIDARDSDQICQAGSMPDLWMPIDFVHYKVPKCNKLLVFYPHLVRSFAPNASILMEGQDYVTHPFQPIHWMPSSVRAIMYSNGHFYLFAAGNTLYVEKGKKLSECSLSSVTSASFDTFLASEFMLSVSRKIIGSINAPKSQFIPYRYGTLVNSNEIRWEPPLDRIVQFNEELLPNLTPGIPANDDDDRDDVKDIPTPKTPEIPATPATPTTPAPKEEGNFATVLIICIVLIVVSIACGIIYYYFFSSSAESAPYVGSMPGRSRKAASNGGAPSPSKVVAQPSGISGQLTARSAIASKVTPPAPVRPLSPTRRAPSPPTKRSPSSPKSVHKSVKSSSPGRLVKSSPGSIIKSNKSHKSFMKSPNSMKSAKSSASKGPMRSGSSKSPGGRGMRRTKSAKSLSPGGKS